MSKAQAAASPKPTQPPHPEERPPGASRRTPPPRRYAGIPLEQRQAERRDRLVRAAITVASRAGRDAATVAAICAEAELTARYFYESFPNREALFLTAFGRVQDELFARIAVFATGRDPVRGALTGFFTVLAENPGPARVFLVDLDESDLQMKALGHAAGARLGALFAPTAPRGSLAEAGATGAVIEIARRWVRAGFNETIDTAVATALPFARAAKSS